MIAPQVFMHVWTGKDAVTAQRCADIYAEMYAAMESSGLLREARFHPIRTAATSEIATLCWMAHDALDLDPATPMLYCHLKGATWLPDRQETACVDDWRRLMTHFCIDRWPDALEALRTKAAVGCNVSTARGRPHFSGNFWWTTAGAIKALPTPRQFWERMEAEFWIGGVGLPKMASLHQSGVDHYFVRYPPDLYEEAHAS